MKKTKPYRPSMPDKSAPKPREEERMDFSPEGISKRSSATTEVLNEMLERERRAYNLRYWGINE